MVSLEGIINSLEEAIMLFDKLTGVIFMNKTAEELFGKNAKDVPVLSLSSGHTTPESGEEEGAWFEAEILRSGNVGEMRITLINAE